MSMIGASEYIKVFVLTFIVNIIPAFMPPTWVVLSLYKIHNEAINTVLLALFGALGSTTGRFIMYKYSELFRRFMSKGRLSNLDDLNKVLSKDKKNLFIWTFIFSLSPIPSNFLFISGGIVKIDPKPLLLGFFSGRFVSYAVMILLSFSIFNQVELIYDNAKLLFDIIGIIGALLIIFIDWDKTIDRLKGIKRYKFKHH